MSSSDNDTENDEPTLKELQKKRETRERVNWSTDDLDDIEEAKENKQQLLARRKQFADALADNELPPVTQNAYEEQVGEIDELLAVTVEDEAEEKRTEARRIRRQLETSSTLQKDEWADEADEYREKADALEAEAEELEQQLPSGGDPDALSATAVAGGSNSSDFSVDDPTGHVGKVSTAHALKEWDIDSDELDEEIAARKDTIAKLSGEGRSTTNQRLTVEVLEEAAAGNSWWEADNNKDAVAMSLLGMCKY